MSYIIGNLIGRLLMSAFLVWIVLLMVHRFNLPKSLKTLLRPLPVVFTVALFLLGLASNAVANTKVASQAPFNEKQLFSVTTLPKIGVNEIYIPAEPHWLFETTIEDRVKKITLTPQRNTDILAAVELSQHSFFVPDEQYQTVRNSITDTMEQSLNSSLKVVYTSKNHLDSFSYECESSSDGLTLRHQLEVFLSNQRIWTFYTVVSEQSDKPFQVFRQKIFDSIRINNTNTPAKG